MLRTFAIVSGGGIFTRKEDGVSFRLVCKHTAYVRGDIEWGVGGGRGRGKGYAKYAYQ